MTKDTHNIQAPDTTGFHAGWSVDGVTYRNKLAEAWEEAGLDTGLLPPRSTSPQAALTKTAEGLRSRRDRRFPRPLPNCKGYVLVDEETEGDDLEWNEELRMVLVTETDPPQVLVTPFDHALVPQIRDAYNKHLETLTAADMTTWLGKLIERLNGIHMLRRGSWYFMPHDGEEMWLKAVAVIRSVCSVSFTFSRAYAADAEGVQCILDSLISEADGMISDTREELYPEDEEAVLGERALKTRTKKCKRMRDKVAAYEKLLGRKLPEVQDRLGELEADLVDVSLAVGSGNINQQALPHAISAGGGV